LFGPSVFNFEQIAQLLLEKGASIQVDDADGLMKTISSLLLDDAKRKELGENAKNLLEKHRGAVDRLLKLIIPNIS
jgi:3-deoxy-D-manno-octulosonic-acid transferase